jgi:hypothetical protein
LGAPCRELEEYTELYTQILLKLLLLLTNLNDVGVVLGDAFGAFDILNKETIFGFVFLWADDILDSAIVVVAGAGGLLTLQPTYFVIRIILESNTGNTLIVQ